MELIECNRMSKREMTEEEKLQTETSSKENAEHARGKKLCKL